MGRASARASSFQMIHPMFYMYYNLFPCTMEAIHKDTGLSAHIGQTEPSPITTLYLKAKYMYVDVLMSVYMYQGIYHDSDPYRGAMKTQNLDEISIEIQHCMIRWRQQNITICFILTVEVKANIWDW